MPILQEQEKAKKLWHRFNENKFANKKSSKQKIVACTKYHESLGLVKKEFVLEHLCPKLDLDMHSIASEFWRFLFLHQRK